MNDSWNLYSNISKVYVSNSKYGYGVFAKKNIKKGELVEKGLMQVYKDIDGNKNQYLFTWKDSYNNNSWAAGTGYIPIYNHSKNPNIYSVRDYELKTLTFFALRDIEKDEELFHEYKSASWREAFKDLREDD